MDRSTLPVAVIGAGPVGLAAAVRLLDEGHTPIVFEAGERAGSSILEWGHVRLFSPWKYNVDETSKAMLEASGWQMPDGESFHTGRELVEHYLEPLAALPEIAPHIRFNSTVTAITREQRDKMKTAGREDVSFIVRYIDGDGVESEVRAKAIIDASGTCNHPNPLGAGGIKAIGEAAASEWISYGIPDVAGAQWAKFAGKRVLVVGSGHSAFNVLLDLVQLKLEEPSTEILWAVRSRADRVSYGGAENDQLPARGQLGLRLEQQVSKGAIELISSFQTARITPTADGVIVSSADRDLAPVDRIVATTGFRPDLEMLRELRLDLDPITESPARIAPLIDPNVHSCGSVPPHGAEELRHPEQDLYVVGMKSYGRAPTFLMLTGYEQVRSIVAAISGDWERARDVQLVLPETGVCSTDFTEASCCGTPEPELIQIGASRSAGVE